MTTDELIKALKRLKVETGSLACMGCGHEHNCGLHGCAIMREAAERLRALMDLIDCNEYDVQIAICERDAAVKQLKRDADCSTCRYDLPCGVDGLPCVKCNVGERWEWDGGRAHV